MSCYTGELIIHRFDYQWVLGTNAFQIPKGTVSVPFKVCRWPYFAHSHKRVNASEHREGRQSRRELDTPAELGQVLELPGAEGRKAGPASQVQ